MLLFSPAGKSASWGLPVEIAENIIDFLNEDSTTLSTFSLSCRALLPRSRLHLFAHIRISTIEQMRSASQFLDGRPWLHQLVQRVTTTTELGGRAPYATLEVVPIPLLKRLPNLYEWRIIDTCTDEAAKRQYSPHPLTLSGFRHHGIKIQCLTINGLEFPSIADLGRLLLAFPGLRRFQCQGCKNNGKVPKKPVDKVLRRRLIPQFRLLKHLVVSSTYPSWSTRSGIILNHTTT